MAVASENVTEGGRYLTEANSLGHVQMKEILKIIPDTQDFLRDIVEYQSRTFGSNAPWVRHTCMRKTFAKTIEKILPHQETIAA